MSEPEFTDLLIRFEKGQCTIEENELLEKWLNSPRKGQAPFINEAERIKVKNALRESIFQNTGLSSKSRASSFFKVRLANPPTGGVGMRRLKRAYRIAATILLVAIFGYGTFNFYERTMEEKYAASKISSDTEILKVLLSDGSIVWLKPHSSLIYPKNFRDEGERMVILHGEALFEVEKNPTQPFIAQAGELTATVLGTSFNIKATDKQIEVVVLTGKVSLTSSTDKQGVVVLSDERAIYNGLNKHLAKVEIPIEKPVAEAIVTGTEYNMNFNGTRMSEIIQRIEGKFDAKVNMSDPSLANCVITADFTDQSLTKTMDIIARALTVEYDIEGRQVTLRGQGCN